MQILASSVEPAASAVAKAGGELFLHAGYISAHQRSFSYDFERGVGPIGEAVDVVEALRLKGAGYVANAPLADDGGVAVAAASGLPLEQLLTAVAFCVALALVYRFRGWLQEGRRALALATAAVAVVVLPTLACGEDPLPSHPPWEGVEVQEYLHPALATKVLLHGIIADGLTNTRGNVTALANIQNEVGLPARRLSPGQQYALQTYGLDGWGREFLFVDSTKHPDGECLVRSAGPDGELHTADDISLYLNRSNDDNWVQNRWAHFIRQRENGLLVMFVHRWGGKTFDYHDRTTAEAMTGGALFDACVEPGSITEEMRAEFLRLAWNDDTDRMLLWIAER